MVFFEPICCPLSPLSNDDNPYPKFPPELNPAPAPILVCKVIGLTGTPNPSFAEENYTIIRISQSIVKMIAKLFKLLGNLLSSN